MILVVVEIAYLTYNNIQAVRAVSGICGYPDPKDIHFAIKIRALVTIGLEKRIKSQSQIGIDPYYGLSKFQILMFVVLSRIKAFMTNFFFKLLIRRLLGRYAFRLLIDLIGIPALKLNPNNKNEYIFFNDGDGKSQHQKIVGKTGGFHYTNSVVLDSLILKGFNAKSFGCSGDGPENDFEAILKGIEHRDSPKEIILIADNYSDVRDYSLLEEIDIPVRIILCGLDNHVNEQYLNLAYHSKGSVHSIEEDLNMLKRLSYDSEIKFLGKTYIYTKGGFIFKNDL